MAKFKKRERLHGQWLNNKEVPNKAVLRFTDPAREFPSAFGEDKTQIACHVEFENYPSDPAKPWIVALNRAVVNALVEAFGEESEDWVGQKLTSYKMQTSMNGKRGHAVYYIPEGYQLISDDNDYFAIVKVTSELTEGSEVIFNPANVGDVVTTPDTTPAT
jgi:hypothetical protein